jgi:integrase
MASIKPYGEKGWRAQIARRGVRDSQIFTSKGAAVAWAGTREAEIMAGVRGDIPNLTVKALLDRYKREVSKDKKGRRWEEIRLDALQRDRLASVRLRQLDTPHVSEWQQRRLEAVSGASVRRERNLLNNVFEIARKEWKWLAKNPFEGVRRPKDGKARKRIASQAEIAKLTAADGSMSRVIVWALETGMRAGEIAQPPEVAGRVATLRDSKNGEEREVPLSDKALEVWQGGFGMTAGSISTLFARRCDALGIKGLTFHDLRATAATRLCKRLNPLQLAKMFGWKDLKQAMTYYRESAEDVAKLL